VIWNDTEPGLSGHIASAAGVQHVGVTRAAADLLRTVDAGGVPAFVTRNLVEIAQVNGFKVPDHWTPNQIIEAIRRKVATSFVVDLI